MVLRVEHDPEADALYIYLADEPSGFGEDIDPERRIDCAASGTPIGVEPLNVSGGVDVADLPRADEIARAPRRHHIELLA